MSGTTASNSWDDIWAEFDARHARRAAEAASARRAAGGASARRAAEVASAPRAVVIARDLGAAKARPTKGFRRLVALICLGLAVLYLVSPIASAVQVAAAIRQGDAEALAGHIDWATLRPGLAAELLARARDHDPRPMPAFIAEMARDMTARLAEPEVLAGLLGARLGAGGSPREMLGRVRILEAGLWEVELSPPGRTQPATRLTLALADPFRLRWEVRAITLPSVAGARFR